MKRFIQMMAAVALATLLITPLLVGSVYASPAHTLADQPLAQAMAPAVQVSDQPSSTVITVTKVVATQDGWLDIHANTADNTPGASLGVTAVKAGENDNVAVMVDPTPKPGDKVWAMLHVDAGKIGVWEWPDGPDVPVIVDAAPVMQQITITSDQGINPSIVVADQPASDSLLAIKVEAAQDGFLVVHANNAQNQPGDQLGHVAVKKGTNMMVKVPLSPAPKVGDKVWPMLHIDAGTIGTYEFPGPDAPVIVGGNIVMKQITMTDPSAVNTVDLGDQPSSTYVTVTKVMAAQDGWIDIHANNPDNTPGGGLGWAMLKKGENDNVRVFVDPTPKPGDKIWAMLHMEVSQPGAFNWPGPDAPVVTSGTVVMKQVSITTQDGVNPAVAATDQTAGSTLLVLKVEAAQDGWITVHANTADNKPGDQLGHTSVKKGTNNMVKVDLNPVPKAGDKVWPMLHIDAGAIGTYEFPGPDAPVIIDGNIVMKEITLTAALPAAAGGTPTAAMTGTATVATPTSAPVVSATETLATPTAGMVMTGTATMVVTPTVMPLEASPTAVMLEATPTAVMQPTAAAPGLPRTGAGDDTGINLALLVALATLLLGGGALLRRRRTA